MYVTKNNSLLTLTDLSGTYTFFKISAGQISKTDRNKTSMYTSICLAQEILKEILKKKIEAIYIRIRAVGGPKSKKLEFQSQVMLKLLKKETNIISISNVTPVPHDSTRMKGGRRGRRV